MTSTLKQVYAVILFASLMFGLLIYNSSGIRGAVLYLLAVILGQILMLRADVQER